MKLTILLNTILFFGLLSCQKEGGNSSSDSSSDKKSGFVFEYVPDEVTEEPRVISFEEPSNAKEEEAPFIVQYEPMPVEEVEVKEDPQANSNVGLSVLSGMATEVSIPEGAEKTKKLKRPSSEAKPVENIEVDPKEK